MLTHLQQHNAEHRQLLEVAGHQAGFAAPMAFNLDEFSWPLIKASRRGPYVPIDGSLIRAWGQYQRRWHGGIHFGMRCYQIEGVKFVQISVQLEDQESNPGRSFAVVDQKDYLRLFKIALRCRRDDEPAGPCPILPQEQANLLWKNTIGYLDRKNLRTIKSYGGRAKRGLLLTGAPGNGKTMACRWIWEECRRRHWEWRLVTPDTYRQARTSCNPQEAVNQLFSVDRCGIVFFDDMDMALRDRNQFQETDDQAVFLGALDGIKVNEGVVFVFTTNCSLDLIDRAFKRPGRLDLVLHFKAPDADLRRRLMERWHADIQAGIDLDHAINTSAGYSFAELEELKNLLILRFMDEGDWDWDWALRQFDINRSDLAQDARGKVGFCPPGMLATSLVGEN